MTNTLDAVKQAAANELTAKYDKIRAGQAAHIKTIFSATAPFRDAVVTLSVNKQLATYTAVTPVANEGVIEKHSCFVYFEVTNISQSIFPVFNLKFIYQEFGDPVLLDHPDLNLERLQVTMQRLAAGNGYFLKFIQ